MYRAIKYTVFALAALSLAILAIWLSGSPSKERLRVSAGSQGGTYHAFATALAEVVNQRSQTVELSVLTSAGSTENAARLSTRDTELGLIQADTVLGKGATIAARLYPEVFHLIARNGSGIRSVADLAGKKIALQKRGSGSNILFSRLLEHYELKIEDIEPVYASFLEGEKMLREGRVDALFIVIALGNQNVENLIQSSDAELISIDQAEALAMFDPALRADRVPLGAYSGRGPVPKTPIDIVAVDSLLAIGPYVSDKAAEEITRTLFDSRQLLVQKIAQAAFIGQPAQEHRLSFAVHPGALRYYNQDEPPFLVEYAEPMALGMSVIVLLVSGLWQARSWLSNKRKNRADHYNLELIAFTHRIEAARSQSDLDRIRSDMFQIFEKVIVDLDHDQIEQRSLQSFSFAWNVAISALNGRQIALANEWQEETPRKQAKTQKRQLVA